MQFARQTNSETMETLAKQIEERMHGDWSMIRDEDLERFWPINEEDREEKIAQFAKRYGFRLRVYLKGICAIFDKWSPEEHT
jgi:hypothetical protein